MAARLTVTVTVTAAAAAVIAVGALLLAREPPPSETPSGDACTGPGVDVDLHPIRRLSPRARFVATPDVVVDAITGRATIAFATARHNPARTPMSLWSVDLPGSRADAQLIRAGEGRYPGFYVMDRPDHLVIDAAGNQTALWGERPPQGYDDYRVMTATRPAAGGSWSPPTELDSRPGFKSMRLAVNGSGAAVAAWVQRETRLYASYRSSRTGPWSSRQLLSRRIWYFSDVGIDAAGNAVAMYDRPSGVSVRRRDVTTGTWAPATRLSDGTSVDQGEGLAVSAGGTATASWLSTVRGQGYTWLTARMRTNGTWRPSVPMRAKVPDGLAVDGLGRALAVSWTPRHGNLLVMRSRPDGSWHRPTVLARAQHPPDDVVARVAMNGRGDALVVWKAARGVDPQLRGRYRPVGGPWTPERRLTQAGLNPGQYAAAVGERGEAAVAWTGSRSVWARRIALCP